MVLFIFWSEDFKLFGQFGWHILFGVMLIRPLTEVFPRVLFFRKLMLWRREFGVLSGILFLLHVAGYFLRWEVLPWTIFSDSSYLGWSNFLFWGLLGIIILIPVFITSNNFFQRTLKQNWKRVQRLSYVLFLAGVLHIYFLGEYYALLEIIILVVFWVLAWRKRKPNL